MSEVLFMKIYVDADASPVNDIVIEVATGKKIPVILVKRFDHFSRAEEIYGVEIVYVDNGEDVSDFPIIKLSELIDIIITQDFRITLIIIDKGCTVIHHIGFAYTNDNIDQLL